MRIAIASDDKKASGHFGHCKGFEVIEIENGDVKDKTFLENPGHKPGFLPKFLSEKNIDVIITGGMGAKAQVLFNENNIKVVTGAEGEIDDIVTKYINGDLSSTDEVCDRHEHSAGDCH